AGAGDITSVEAMAADLATPFVTDVLALLHNDVTLTEIVCETSDGSTVVQGAATVGESGTASGELTSVNNCVVVSHKTGEVYRGGKARTYLSGIPATALDTGTTWGGTYLGAVATGWANFVTTAEALSGDPPEPFVFGVWHKHSGGVPLTPWVFSPFYSLAVQQRVCSQRRRLGRELPTG
ncbi:MAG: hypothetical protein ACRDT5_25280, partial [Mycobacterium sp.]